MKHLKQEFDKLSFKEIIVYSLAIVSMLAGVVLLFLGMYIPPEGQIHESVLTAFGMICLFVGSLLGISLHYENQFMKFRSAIIEEVRTSTADRREVTA